MVHIEVYKVRPYPSCVTFCVVNFLEIIFTVGKYTANVYSFHFLTVIYFFSLGIVKSSVCPTVRAGVFLDLTPCVWNTQGQPVSCGGGGLLAAVTADIPMCIKSFPIVHAFH